ncbi:tetratricopeptide repeat protein [Niveispirillum fermenti]|uniref:tetratricopeptide repeat protein n=1 Tax=Niveispirillum fermenti TaxID=1233113 RepID=UPI003A885F36
MIRTRLFTAALLGSALAFGSFAAVMAPSEAFAQKSGGEKGDTVRPAVGTPLQAAQELMKAKKFKEAVTKIKEADAVTDKTPFENFMVEQMRAIASYQAGDLATAEKSFEQVFASGRMPAAQQLTFTQALAQQFYQQKNYTKAIAWTQKYFAGGGNDQNMRTLLLQAYYLNKDFPNAIKEVSAKITAAERAGQTPSEQDLQLLASANNESKNEAGYVQALEKLVRYHPKRDYWLDLLMRTQRKQGFARDRLALDSYRLMNTVGLLDTTNDYMEMAQLSLQAGNPGEAKGLIDKGYAAGLLGKGAEAERHKRLKDLADRQVAEDQKSLAQTEREAVAGANGGPILRVAEAYAGYGNYEKAATLAEAAIAKGNLRNPDDARLRLVTYYLALGQKAKAETTLKAIKSTDGPADLGRLYMLHAAKTK